MAPLYASLRIPQIPDVAGAVAQEFSPRLHRYSAGCVVLDVSGLGRLLGDAETIGAELTQACTIRCAGRDPRSSRSHGPSVRCHPACQVAVAPTQMAAQLLSLAYPGLTVVDGDVESALEDLPLRCLHQLLAEIDGATVLRTKHSQAQQASAWDLYERAFTVLYRWGVATLGGVAALPPEALSARLGQEGVELVRCARGIDRRPLVPDPDVVRFLEHVELEWPIDGLEPLSFVLARMLDPLSASLERADRGAAALHLRLRLVDRTTHERLLQLPASMRDPRVLRTLLLLDLESHPPSAAIDHITIEIDPAPGRVIQYSLLERARPSAETLATLNARLGALVGETRCGSPVLLDSHRSDAFELRRFTGPEPMKDSGNMMRSRSDASEPRVFTMLRRFRPPVAIRVQVERGRPVRIPIDRRGMPGGIVEQAAGPWRTSGAWWQPVDDPSPAWNRDEWDVALADGSVCRLFHERNTGRWFMEALID